jgi:hypothetical protein
MQVFMSHPRHGHQSAQFGSFIFHDQSHHHLQGIIGSSLRSHDLQAKQNLIWTVPLGKMNGKSISLQSIGYGSENM